MFASFDRVMILEVLYDFWRNAFGVGHAERLDHFVDFGFPSFRWKRRLHDDISRAVAGAAVRLCKIAVLARGESRSIEGVIGHAIGGAVRLSLWNRLRNTAGILQCVVAIGDFRLCTEKTRCQNKRRN